MIANKATTIPSFNPTKDERVDWIKGNTEAMLTFLQNLEDVDPRCKALALTNYEQAAMWAVKSLFNEVDGDFTELDTITAELQAKLQATNEGPQEPDKMGTVSEEAARLGRDDDAESSA